MEIGLLEDDSLTRFSIAESLETHDLIVRISVSTAHEFMDAFVKYRLDAVLLDLHLGDGPSGVDVANRLRAMNSKLGIVFLTSFDDPRLLSNSLGEIPPNSRYLIKKEIRNMQFLADEIAKSVLPLEPTTGPIKRVSKLSNSQIETLRLVAEGYSNAEIAKRQFVSEKTVESTITKMAKMLQLDNSSGKNLRVQLAQAYFGFRGMRH